MRGRSSELLLSFHQYPCPPYLLAVGPVPLRLGWSSFGRVGLWVPPIRNPPFPSPRKQEALALALFETFLEYGQT